MAVRLMKIGDQDRSRLVGLGGPGGLEAGLREGGCSEYTIDDLLRWDQPKTVFSNYNFTNRDREVFLGVIGHTSRVNWNTIHLTALTNTSNSIPRLTEREVAAMCANLGCNTNITDVQLSGHREVGTPSGCKALGNVLETNFAIQVLCLSDVEMDADGVRYLMDGLRLNKAVLALDLSRNPLYDVGMKIVAELLRENRTLISLNITHVGLRKRGAEYISSALEDNTTLEGLSFGGQVKNVDHQPTEWSVFKRLLQQFGLNETEKRLPQPFGLKPNEVSKNTTLKTLKLIVQNDLRGGPYDDNAAEIANDLAWTIKTNKSLSTLQLVNVRLWRDSWTSSIFGALKENKTLRKLDLNLCEGFTNHEGDALLHLLQSNEIGLTEINLSRTELMSFQGRVDEELRKNNDYRIKLHDQALLQSKSGRLILCGFGYAGKTSICMTMEAIDHEVPRSFSLNTFWKKTTEKFPGLQRLLFGNDAYKDAAGRTRGFNVVSLKQQRHLKFIWDFAGQKAYYALHDYLFPDTKNSCFLYVCSCRCPPSPEQPKGAIKCQESMKDECEYWMKFIASNSEPHRKQLPQVRFVLTNRDTLTSGELSISKQWARRVVRDLKIVFKDVLLLCETVEVVDAHSVEDVNHLLTVIDESLKEILEHQTEYALCEEVRSVLAEQPSDSPIMSCDDFYSISGGRFKFQDAPKEIREAILAYLNDLGEVIFPKGFDFLVTNPRWFGVRVLGLLIDSFKAVEGSADPACSNLFCRRMESIGLVHEKGFVDRIDVNDLLEDSLHMTDLQQTIPFEKLIDLMIHLELCFESQPGTVNSPLFFPALFDDDKEAAANGLRQLEWKLEQKEPLQYIGRRLECQNKATTFLTPGFFPRLQVHLRNHFHEKQWTDNHGFAVDRNLICFAHNGVEILVEYSGDIDYFIDVLVRSSKPHAEALEFVGTHVIRKIQDFCALQKGCQGVLLVEAVIRKVCVEELHLCKDRKRHSVLVSTLRAGLEKDVQFRHTWSQPNGDAKDTDFALELLDGECPQRNLVQIPAETSTLAASSSTYSDQFPMLFYPSIEDVAMLDRLNTRLNLAKKMPIKLHLMCDHRDGHHVVEKQPGRTISLNRKGGGYDVPILKLAVTLLWTGVGVVSSIGGASLKVPQVDNWIDNLFSVHEMPDVNGETLHEVMNRGKSSKQVAEQDILKALERYWKLDPQSQGLKQILNLQDTAEFWNDFQLRKVVYTEAPHQGKIGWVCDRHYWPGLKKGVLRSV